MSASPTALGRRTGRDPRAVARELRVLLRFRLSVGGRDPRQMVALIVVLALGLGVALPVAVALWAPRGPVDRASVLVPWVWLFFGLASVLASLAASGGREVLPRREALVFPVSSTADQLGALLLTPLNVAWSLQAVGVLTLTCYVAGPGAVLPLALAAAGVWVVAATALAQLLGWCGELARTYRWGVPVLRLLAVVLVGVLALALHLGDADDVATLAAPLLTAAELVARSPLLTAAALLALAGASLAAVMASVPLGERLRSRPTPVESRAETRRHRRTREVPSELARAVRLDVLSVVRSPPLRRGLLVLLATPVLVATLLPLPWPGIILLPALVASGTALLHGVNATALDGRGALWRESLPQHPDVTLIARLAALTVLCGGSCAAVVLLAALRAEPPSTAQAVAAAAAVLLATAQVVSRCARWSVRRPYPAELRTGRDTPAPPAAMALYSARLSTSTTGGAVLLAVGALLGLSWLCVVVTTVLVSASALRLTRALRQHRDPLLRARVAATVAGA